MPRNMPLIYFSASLFFKWYSLICAFWCITLFLFLISETQIILDSGTVIACSCGLWHWPLILLLEWWWWKLSITAILHPGVHRAFTSRPLFILRASPLGRWHLSVILIWFASTLNPYPPIWTSVSSLFLRAEDAASFSLSWSVLSTTLLFQSYILKFYTHFTSPQQVSPLLWVKFSFKWQLLWVPRGQW